jgi:uncharacterized membrane protein
MREFFLILLSIIALIAFFKIATSISNLNGKEFTKGFYSLFGMALILSISIVLNFTLIDQNNRLVKENRGKCPEYEQIDAYILKKK